MLSVKSSHFDELWPFYVVVATDDIKFSFKDCLQTTLESLTSVYFLHTRVWHIGGLNKCWQTTACSLFSLVIFLIHETCLAWPNFCFPKTESLQRISICCHWGDFFRAIFRNSFQRYSQKCELRTFIWPGNKSGMDYFKSVPSFRCEILYVGRNSN